MLDLTPRPGDLDPIETASRDELRALQLDRLRRTLRHAYEHVPHYRRGLRRAPGSTRTTAASSTTWPRLPVHRPRPTCAANYPFGMFAVPREQVRADARLAGTTGQPTVVGYTEDDIDTWADGDGPVDPRRRRPAGRPRAHRLRLRAVHRRAGRALRRRAAGLHGRPGLGRHDRAPGAAHPRLPAGHHHGHARRTCWRSSTRWRGRASTRADTSLQGRHLRRRAVDRGHAPRDRGRAWTCTPSTSTACRR